MMNHVKISKAGLFVLGVLCTVLCGSTSAATLNWTNGFGDNLWTTSQNWDANAVPDTLDTAIVAISDDDPNRALINADVNDVAALWVGAVTDGRLEITTGGDLTTTDIFSPVTSGHGTTNVDGGTLTTTNYYLGYQNTATVNITNSGIVNAANFYGGHIVDAEINVESSGQLNLTNVGYLAFSTNAMATLNIDGGTVTAPTGLWTSYLAGTDSEINVYDGALNVPTAGQSLLIAYTGVSQANFFGGISNIDTIFMGFSATADPNLYIGTGATVNCPTAYLGYFAPGETIIDGGTLQNVSNLYLTSSATASGTEMTVKSGAVTAINTYVGFDAGAATLNMEGGTFSATTFLYAGYTATSTGSLNVSGGTIDVLNFLVGWLGNADVNMTGGVINVGSWGMAVGYGSPSPVSIDLSGGTITTDVLSFGAGSGAGGTIDITGSGKLVLTGDQRANVAIWVADDNLTGNGTKRGLKVELVGGNTEVTYDEDLLKVAWDPSPVGPQLGSTYDSTILTWSEGHGADSHDVYFGTNETAVEDANTGSPEFKGNQLVGDEDYDPGTLDLGKTYYWRIDEHADGNLYEGSVWSFSIADYIILDDFESYTDTTALQAAWTGADELSTTVTNGTLSTKSMAVDYNNTTAPYTPEQAVRSYAGAPIDLNNGQVEAIHLWFHGLEDNSADALYIQLTDTSNNSATVYYSDNNDLKQPVWQNFWNRFAVALDDFSGVDINEVNEVAIGVGNGSAGGAGTVYIDDVRLYIPVYVESEAEQAGDVFREQIVDFVDYSVLASLFGRTEMAVSAQTVSSTGLRVHYTFNDTLTDSSGNNFNAAAPFGEVYAAGYDGNSFDLRGNPLAAKYISIPNAPDLFSTVDDEVTIACWVKGDETRLPIELPYTASFIQGSDDFIAPIARKIAITLPETYGFIFFDTGEPFGSTLPDDGSALPYDRNVYQCQATSEFAGQWNHYAFVKDTNTGFQGVYINGVMVCGSNGSIGSSNSGSLTGIQVFWIGDAIWSGQVDEFRIYDRALSQGEIIDLAGLASVQQPLVGRYGTISLPDLDDDGDIDNDDLEIFASNWLYEPVFP